MPGCLAHVTGPLHSTEEAKPGGGADERGSMYRAGSGGEPAGGKQVVELQSIDEDVLCPACTDHNTAHTRSAQK